MSDESDETVSAGPPWRAALDAPTRAAAATLDAKVGVGVVLRSLVHVDVTGGSCCLSAAEATALAAALTEAARMIGQDVEDCRRRQRERYPNWGGRDATDATANATATETDERGNMP